jgi:GntR family transcriptional repressor for pyruvate dehydrogenase complex
VASTLSLNLSPGFSSAGLIDELTAYIRNEGFRAGDRLPPIRRLSKVLKAGRNLVRDGLLEAQTLGLVRIEPRKGVFVAGDRQEDGVCRMLERVLARDEPNLFHLVDARRVVESELAAEAARTRRPEDLLPLRQALEKVLAAGDDRESYVEADEAYHHSIARIAGNRVLSAFLEVLWRLIRPAKTNLALSPQNRRLSDTEHQELFRSIVDGDAAGARAKMDEHIRQGQTLLLDYACTLPEAAGETRAIERPVQRRAERRPEERRPEERRPEERGAKRRLNRKRRLKTTRNGGTKS